MLASLQVFAVVARENHGRQEVSYKSPSYALFFSYTETSLLTVIDHKLHKIRNIQKFIRFRSPEGGFQRIVHDIPDEIKPGIRFQSRAFAVLQEAIKSFATTYFTSKFFVII